MLGASDLRRCPPCDHTGAGVGEPARCPLPPGQPLGSRSDRTPGCDISDDRPTTDATAQTPRIEGYDPDDFDDFGRVAPAPFVDETLGIQWDLLSPDRVEAHVDADERHHQPYGIVHGGVYCGVVETLASVGAALRVLGDGNVVVGVHNATDFIRAHRTGRLDAVATPLHVGRTQHLWEVVLTRAEDGKQVARGQVRLQVLPADRALAGSPAQPATGEDGR